MIEYKNDKEKELLLAFAKQFGSADAQSVLEKNQVGNLEDVRSLARLYWRMVDKAEGENMDYWLERIYTTLHIHVSNSGYEHEWDTLIP